MTRIFISMIISFYWPYLCFATNSTTIEFNESSQAIMAPTFKTDQDNEIDTPYEATPFFEDEKSFLQRKIFDLSKEKKIFEEELHHYKDRIADTEERLARATYDLNQEKDEKSRLIINRDALEKELEWLKQSILDLDLPKQKVDLAKLKERNGELLKSLVENVLQNKKLITNLELLESSLSAMTDKNKALKQRLKRMQLSSASKNRFIKSAKANYEEIQSYCRLLEGSNADIKQNSEQIFKFLHERAQNLDAQLTVEKQKVVLEQNKLKYAIELSQQMSVKMEQQAELDCCRKELDDLRHWKQTVMNNPCLIPGSFCFDTTLDDGSSARIEMTTQEMYYALLENKNLQKIIEERKKFERDSADE